MQGRTKKIPKNIKMDSCLDFDGQLRYFLFIKIKVKFFSSLSINQLVNIVHFLFIYQVL